MHQTHLIYFNKAGFQIKIERKKIFVSKQNDSLKIGRIVKDGQTFSLRF